MPARALPMATLYLYDPGAGDPVMTSPWWGHYAILERTFSKGTFSLDANQIPKLEIVPGVGLCCRPFLELQAAVLGDWTTSGGLWELRTPAVQRPKARLTQYQCAADTVWAATSTFTLAANPDIAFSALIFDTPGQQDYATYPPLIRFEFGGGAYAVELHSSAGCRLLRAEGGVWYVAAELPQPTVPPGSSLQEYYFFVRHLRGKLAISTDFGRTYTLWAPVDGSAVSVPAGSVVIRGQGHSGGFGLHQLKYFSGTYTSPAMNTGTARAAMSPTLAYRGTLPASTAVTVGDDSPAGSTVIARYTVDLTPATVVGSPFDLYRSPAVQAVQMEYEATATAGAGTYTRPADDAIMEVEIEEPAELAAGTCRIEVRKAAALAWDIDAWQGKWRAGKLYLGFLNDDRSQEVWLAWTGYLRTTGPHQASYNRQYVTLEFDNMSARYHRQRWEPVLREPVPLGGLTVNAALDKVLGIGGLDTSYRSWHGDGALITLPTGTAEDPAFLPRVGETLWDTLATIAAYGGLELTVSRAGIFGTVRCGAVSATVVRVLEADPALSTNRINRIDFRYDSSENVTRVIATGEDEAGNPISALFVDEAAETSTSNARYSPWPESIVEIAQGTVNPAIVSRVAQGLAAQHLPPKFDAEVTTALDLANGRRARVRVTETTVGIEDLDEFAVITCTHRFSRRLGECLTTFGLQRL